MKQNLIVHNGKVSRENPEFPYPQWPNYLEDSPLWNTIEESKYNEARQDAIDNSTDYEDQDRAKNNIWGAAIPHRELKDGFYPGVEMGNCKEIEQYSEPMDIPAKWKDGNQKTEHPKELFRRVILRFVDSEKEEPINIIQTLKEIDDLSSEPAKEEKDYVEDQKRI